MLTQIRKDFDRLKIDALLVTNPSNILALTKFKSSNCSLLITKHYAYLFTDPRYLEKAQSEVDKAWRIIDLSPGFFNILHNILLKHRSKFLGFEARQVTYDFYLKLQSLYGFKLCPTNLLVENYREQKTADELRLLRQAQKLNEQVLKLVLPKLKPAVTEGEIAWQIECLTRQVGALKCAFDPIVAFGAHSARPHHEISATKKLKRGDLVLIDMGVVYKGYASDMTRTFFTKTPTAQQAHVYNTVLQANLTATQIVKAGVTADEVDKAARIYISDQGYKHKFGHATGHGIGLDVHELPLIAKGNPAKLKIGAVITIEPGIYLAQKLGVRIEDMLEVTDTGYKLLTKFPKDLFSAQIKV